MGRTQIFVHKDLYKQFLRGPCMYLLLIEIPIFHLEIVMEGRKNILFCNNLVDIVVVVQKGWLYYFFEASRGNYWDLLQLHFQGHTFALHQNLNDRGKGLGFQTGPSSR